MRFEERCLVGHSGRAQRDARWRERGAEVVGGGVVHALDSDAVGTLDGLDWQLRRDENTRSQGARCVRSVFRGNMIT